MTSPSMSTTVGDSRDERQPDRVHRTGIFRNFAYLIEEEDLPTPIEVRFYERGTPEWGDARDTVAITFANSLDMTVWCARLGWNRHYWDDGLLSSDGSKRIFSCFGELRGWGINGHAYTAVTQ